MKRESGFTLLEILIALFIFAIIATITATMLHTIINAHQDSERYYKRLTQIQLAISLIRKDLQQIAPQAIYDEKGKLLPPIYALPQHVEFTRAGLVNPNFIAKRSTMQRVAIYLQNNTLYLKTWDQLNRNLDSHANTKILLTDVDQFDVQYLSFGQGFADNWPPGNLPRQSNSGLNNFPIPRAIKIKLVLAKLGKLNLIVPIHISNLAKGMK